MVYEPDRPKMIEAASVYNILLKLKDKNSFSTVYRSLVNGKIQYSEMKIVKIGTSEFPTEVVIGFADRSVEKNNEIERELNTQRILNLSSNLEAVVEINLSDGAYYFRTAVDIADNPMAEPFIRTGFLGEDELNEFILTEIYPDDRSMLQSLLTTDGLTKRFSERTSFEINYRYLDDGSLVWKAIKGVLNTKNNAPVAIIGLFNIDQEQRQIQKHMDEVRHLAYEASYDKLTGIRNRNAYISKEAEMNQMISSGSLKEYAVAVFDINSLKDANDEKGHDKGDELIKATAAMICDTFKHSPVFRIGGDEFVVLLSGTDYTNRKSLIDKLYKRSKDNNDGVPIFAIGIADKNEDDRMVSDTFKRADKAMYANKVLIKNGVDTLL